MGLWPPLAWKKIPLQARMKEQKVRGKPGGTGLDQQLGARERNLILLRSAFPGQVVGGYLL